MMSVTDWIEESEGLTMTMMYDYDTERVGMRNKAKVMNKRKKNEKCPVNEVRANERSF